MIKKMNNPLSQPGKFHYIIALTLILGLSFVLRCHNWQQVFWKGKFVLDMPDVYYHLRIVELIFRGHFSSPLFDWYLNYPLGGLVYWPLGFDWLMSLIGLPAYLLTHDLQSSNFVMATAIPFLGTLSIYVLYRINKRELIDPFFAVILALLPTASFALVSSSLFGRIDQQVVEILVYAIDLFLLLYLLEVRNRKASVALGIMLGLSLWMWNGSIFHAALVYGAFAIASIALKDSESLFQNWRDTAFVAFVTGSLVVLFYGAVWITPFSSVYLSLFHVGCLFLGFLAPFFIRRGKIISRRYHIRPIHWIVGGVFIVFIFYLWFSHSSQLMAIFLKKDPVAATSMESWSLVQMYGITGILQQPLIFLSPLCVLSLTASLRKRKRIALSSALLSLLFLTGIVGFIQFRFVKYFELTTAVSLAVSIQWILKNFPNKRKLMIVTLLAVSVLPFYRVYSLSTSNQSGFQSMRPVEAAMAWLRTHSPRIPHYLDPETKPDPAYSVFCPDWAIGHSIIYKSHRPVVATPFGGTQRYKIGIEACVLGMLTEKESVFYAICQRFKSRYVVCQGLRVANPDDLKLIYKIFTGKTVSVRMENSFYYRLFNWNNWTTGKLNSPTNGFQHFRLIYNSRFIMNGAASVLRIYQVVPGAQIHVQLPLSRHHFVAAMKLSPRYGKPVLYRVDLQPDASGHAAFLCPYSTDTNGDVKAISKLEIYDMDKGFVVGRSPVSSKAVQEGLSVNVLCEDKLGPVREKE